MSTLTLAVNQNNDLYLDTFGNIAMAKDQNAVMQICQQVAQTVRGEMQYHIDEGIPFFNAVWGGNPNILQFEAALRVALKELPEVVDIVGMTITIDKNIFKYKVSIATIYGQNDIQGTIANAGL